MSVISPNETAKNWRPSRREAAVHLYLSDVTGDAAALVGARAAGFPLALSLLPSGEAIDPQEVASAAAVIVQVDREVPESVNRFETLAAASEAPLIAAAYDPPLAFVRSLVRSGAHDVIPLPLNLEELETSLAPIRDRLRGQARSGKAEAGKVIGFVKSVGGIGATALMTQLGIRFAQQETRAGREACLIDLDVQFGDAAFQLGLQPSLTIADLLEAGARLDADLLRSIIAVHSSGLKVIAAPPEMLPLEALSSEQTLEIVELAAREFGTVFVDLPANWTNWSLSVLARSDLVILLTELSVTSIHRAKRQLELMSAQELEDLEIRVVVNRFEKGLLRTIKPGDVRQVLGRDIAYTVSNDREVMQAAIDRGVPIAEVKRKSAVGRDIDTLDSGIAAALRLER